MELNQLTGLSTSVSAKVDDAIIAKAQEQQQTVEEETTAAQQDTYTSKGTDKKVTYKMDTTTVAKMKSESSFKFQAFQSMVEKLVSKQSSKGAMATSGNLKKFYQSLTVDAATAKKAQEDISEDGYWGVNKTSERILNFAKALSGGDPDKIDSLRNAVEKGFKNATKAWGDELPGISQQTYDAVMKGFDDWADSFKTTEAVE